MDEQKTRYLCIDEPARDLSGDIFTEVYKTPEEANIAADWKWSRLTRYERKRRHVFAAMVTEECLAEEAFEDDEIIWEMWTDLFDFPGAFDSEKV